MLVNYLFVCVYFMSEHHFQIFLVSYKGALDQDFKTASAGWTGMMLFSKECFHILILKLYHTAVHTDAQKNNSKQSL